MTQLRNKLKYLGGGGSVPQLNEANDVVITFKLLCYGK